MKRIGLSALVVIAGLGAALPAHAGCGGTSSLAPGEIICLQPFLATGTYSYSCIADEFVLCTVSVGGVVVADAKTDYLVGNGLGSGYVNVCAEREPIHTTPATNVQLCVGP